MSSIEIVIALIMLAGLFGGWAAHLNNGPSVAEPRSLTHDLILGLVAASCVPLFLSLVQSGLLDKIFASPKPPAYGNYLIFFGLCVLAAVSSKRFISSLSKRVLQDLERAKEEAHEAKVVANEAREDASVAAEIADETLATNTPSQGRTIKSLVDSDAPIDLKVLKAMTKMTFRTASGIAADTGISRAAIGELLDQLHEGGLIEPTVSPATRGPRWRITELGIAQLKMESKQTG